MQLLNTFITFVLIALLVMFLFVISFNYFLSS
nr:MAG TPA: Large-conductance mechanosensitive channel activated ion channel mechanosensitive.5A [Caudoviricetes sp.]